MNMRIEIEIENRNIYRVWHDGAVRRRSDAACPVQAAFAHVRHVACDPKARA
jgi:hypothetical protein